MSQYDVVIIGGGAAGPSAALGELARAFLHADLTRLRETVGEALDVEDRTTLDVLCSR